MSDEGQKLIEYGFKNMKEIASDSGSPYRFKAAKYLIEHGARIRHYVVKVPEPLNDITQLEKLADV